MILLSLSVSLYKLAACLVRSPLLIEMVRSVHDSEDILRTSLIPC
jgi:hypothetical protein